MTSSDPRRFLRYLEAERKASLLYRALAQTVDGDRREAFLELAAIEDDHAAHWIAKLTEHGVPVPPAPTTLDPQDETLVARARAAGIADVLGHLEANEGADAGMYDEEPEALATMPSDEREHALVFRRMLEDASGPGDAISGGAIGSVDTTARDRFPHDGGGESWHRNDRTGSVRAAVFGVSDGLVSNTALVMGFAGATTAASGETNLVLLSGLAGLLAGAFSMAAGEYVSVSSQRDLFQREIAMEAEELREKPEEEQRELELLYRAKGLTKEAAAQTAAQLMRDPKNALDTLAREELGLDPSELGSPWKVALTSFVTFAAGAVVPVVPYVFLSGTAAFWLAVALAVLALVLVGGTVGRLSGRGIAFSAMRQLLWGAGAAAVTFAVGSLIGVSVS